MLGCMKHLSARFRRNGINLWCALLALSVAILNPRIDLPRDIHNYVFVLDITQSMNVRDMQVGGIAVNRLEYARRLLGTAIGKLSCGTKVSVALFANAEVVPLFIPIEVCANYGVLQDVLANLEWRMAWRGSSHLRLGLQSASAMLTLLPEPAQIVFFTDGDEAAPINAITKIELTGLQGSSGWLLAGIGADTPSPVPKFNAKDEIIGYWSAYATKIEPSQIVNEDSLGKRDDSIASDPREYYLSALREDYMKEMAQDIGAAYVRADSQEKLLTAIEQLPPAGHDSVPVALGWLFALLAGIFVLAEHRPRRTQASQDTDRPP
jgi:mxaL protein